MNWQLMAAYTYSKSSALAHYRQIFSQNFGTSGYNVAAQDNYNYDDDEELYALRSAACAQHPQHIYAAVRKGQEVLEDGQLPGNLLVRTGPSARCSSIVRAV